MTNEELWLYTLCTKNNLPITDIRLRKLSEFKFLLLEWNKKINLISRKNEENLWKGHIALSLTPLFKISFPVGAKILDLGTGGGFPGIPLAIMLPHNSFLLLDSTQKKINAVQSMAESLALKNVKTIWGRAEELQKQKNIAAAFDAVVARSVSNLTNLVEWGIPFLKKEMANNEKLKQVENKILIDKPSLITFKGMEIDEEEKEMKLKYKNIQSQSIPLIFNGNEEFENLDKKLVLLRQK